MSKPEWGFKRICPACGARYYDFHKLPPVCPSCETEYDPDSLLKSRRSRSGVLEEAHKQIAADKKSAEKKTDPENLKLDEEEDIEELDGDLEDAPGGDDIDPEDITDDEEEGFSEIDPDEENNANPLIEDASELGNDDDVVDVKPRDEKEEDR